jgi:hypothetical protein
MTIEKQIKDYINTQPEPKKSELNTLHQIIIKKMPDSKLWFFDGKDSEGKVVSNPNIGYGVHIIKYADGATKEFYKIGLSANTTGISVYIMGVEDKKFLSETYGEKLGKASVSGYCIKFKTLKDINIEILKEIIKNVTK